MKDCTETTLDRIHDVQAISNGVDYGDCRIVLHRSYFKIMLLGNQSCLSRRQTFLPILSLIETEEGPTLVTICNNQNCYFLLFTLANKFFLYTFAKHTSVSIVQPFQNTCIISVGVACTHNTHRGQDLQ
jgi:hypothetical protein